MSNDVKFFKTPCIICALLKSLIISVVEKTTILHNEHGFFLKQLKHLQPDKRNLIQ